MVASSAPTARRRIDFGDLTSDVRRVAVAALVVALLVAVLLVLAGTDHVPGSTEQSFDEQPIARLIVVVCYLGLAATAVSAAWAALFSRAWERRLLIFAAGALGAVVGADVVRSARIASRFDFLGKPLYPGVQGGLLQGLGWVAFVAGVVLAFMPGRVLVRLRRRAVAALTALPFALALAAYAIAATDPISRGENAQVAILRDPTVPRTAGGFLDDSGAGVALTLGTAVFLLFMWQLIEASRGIRDVGSGTAQWSTRLRSALAAALAVKVVWIALGYAEVGPGWLTGSRALWSASAHDGILSWVLAAVFATAAGAWLVRGRDHRVAEPHVERGAHLVVAGLSCFTVGATVLILILPILRLLPHHPFVQTALSTASWLGNHIEWSFIGTVYLALVVAVILALTRRFTSLALFLALFGIWAAPRATSRMIDLLNGTARKEELLQGLGVAPPKHPGAVDLFTLDTALTAMLLVVYLLVRTGRARTPPAAIMLVLIVSTVGAHSGFLANIFQSYAPLFYGGLVFPAVYQFLFDAEELNDSGADKPRRVLVLVAFTLALLTAALALVAFGSLDRNTTTEETLGRLLFGPPLLALLVAATFVRRAPEGFKTRS